MQKILLLLLTVLVMAVSQANANDSCEIYLNKKVIFKGEAEQKNSVAFVKASQFKSADCLRIVYKSETADKDWKRIFYLTDSADNEIKTIELNKQNGVVSVNASCLQKMKEMRAPVLIYTTSLPKDKGMAARVRVRRLFICKVEWN